MKIARIIAMLLLIAMCMTMIVACNDDSGNQTTTAATTKPTNPGGPSADVDANGFLKDKVPDNNYGVTINIRCWTQGTKEYDLPEPGEDADDIDFALYNRNRKVEDRLGVELKYHEIAGNSTATVPTFVDDVHTAVESNLGSYDIVGAYTRCAGVLAMKGDYLNLYDVDHVDTDMPWWPAEIINTNTISNKLFVATGDIATSLIYQMEFMVINKEYAEEFNIDVDELQALAIDGGWTFDKMLEITSNCYQDVDTTPGKSKEDRFGLHIMGHNLYDLFYMGAGLKYVEPTEDGNSLQISDDYAGAVSRTILTKFADAYKTNNSYFYGSGASIAEGKSLLYGVVGATLATTLRDATFTYRILPAPKFFDTEEYYTAIQFQLSLYAIPKDVKDRSISGAVMEVMASESYRQVTPILFDKVFLYKLTNAESDIALLNIIRDRTTFDLARTFFEDLGGDTNGPVRLWRNLVVNQSTKIQGHVNTNGTRWNSVLKNIYDTISTIEN